MMIFNLIVPMASKQVYGGQHNRLVSFIKDNADTFLLQDNTEEGGKSEVILLRSEGDDGAVAELPTGNATAGKKYSLLRQFFFSSPPPPL